MLTRHQLFTANIDNLTHLWRAMGSNDTPALDGFQASTRWPHRHWFEFQQPLPAQPVLTDLLATLPDRAIVPVWQAADQPNDEAKRLTTTLATQGFALALAQTAMILPASAVSGDEAASADLQITDSDDPIAWARTGSQAFGYEIDPAVIRQLAARADIRLMEARWQDRPAATALLHKTGDIIGIHQVGVTPDFQRRGIARVLMHQAMRAACRWQGRYLTLQASAAGLPLYQQLGFQRQGKICSFRRYRQP